MDELKRALPAMVQAFWDYPETKHLLPSESARRRVLPRFLSADMRAGELRTDGDRGAIAWMPPGAYRPSLARQVRELLPLTPVLPSAIPAAREAQRGSAANRRRHQSHAEPHYFIRVLGVDPSHHGTGVGTALMHHVLNRADNEHVGCFLFTATEANAAWYSSLGFETEERYNPTPTWPDVWAMWRPAR